MLLEMKMVLSSDRTQNMDLNRIISHFDNFKNTFTTLEKESNLSLNEPTSCSLKSNVKKIKGQHEINRIKVNQILHCSVQRKSHRVDFVVYLVIEQQVVH